MRRRRDFCGIFYMNCPLDRTFFTIKQNKKSPVALQFILRNQSTITTILMLMCACAVVIYSTKLHLIVISQNFRFPLSKSISLLYIDI